jgi:hypothetical protein
LNAPKREMSAGFSRMKPPGSPTLAVIGESSQVEVGDVRMLAWIAVMRNPLNGRQTVTMAASVPRVALNGYWRNSEL